jgi:hypothetical protein
MADKYFSSKASAEKANEAAMSAIAEGVRGDLGQVTKAQVGLYRQLQELSAQLTVVGETSESARKAAVGREERLEALERRVGSIGIWVRAGVCLAAVMLGVIIFLVLRLR